MPKTINPLIVLLLIGFVFSAHAGGYRVSTQGQKAMGRAHTGVAMSESSEAVFFNPGAMTRLIDQFTLSTGITTITSENRYQNSETGSVSSTDNPVSTPVNFYLVNQQTEQFAWGFGVYTPFGSVVEWKKDWVGSHLVNFIDLESIFLQPTFALELNDHYSIGGGPIVAISSVELNRNVDTSTVNESGERTNVTVEDSGIVDFGFLLGLHVNVSEKLDFGMSYRSEITVKSKGDATFNNFPDALGNVFTNGGKGKYTSELPLPAELTLGLAYSLNENLLLAFDYNYTFWDVYEELEVTFSELNNPSLNPNVDKRNYKNSSTYRLGLQYVSSPKLTLRAGVYYDETPVSDGYFAPETPRTDSLGFTTGLSYKISDQFELDFSGFYLHFDEEDNSYDFSPEGVFEGSYKVSVWSLGFGLTYRI